MVKNISSLQNPAIKKLQVLRDKSRERRKTGSFVLEGVQELKLALEGNYELISVFFQEALLPLEDLLEFLQTTDQSPELISISPEIYEKLAYRQTTEGVLAIARAKEHRLDQLALNQENPLLLIAEAPEKPGNIGALLRSADAVGISGVIIADIRGDLYNPNTIRSSVGTVFTVPIALASSREILDFLQARKIPAYAAVLGASRKYHQIEWSQPSAIVVGTEATGLSKLWHEEADALIEIPMNGKVDSLNVSVAAAILLFEAQRQRDFNL